MRLVTIPISHFCEKARWALDRAGIAYEEERHVQGLHVLYARRAGGGTTTPVLVTPEEVIGESDEILRWADQRVPEEGRLYPSESAQLKETTDLCSHFNEILGPATRRLIYIRALPQKDLLLRFNNKGVPAWEDRFIRWAWPGLTRLVKFKLDIKPGVEVADERTIFAEFDRMAARLGDGRRYLGGDRFTAADLTFAALSAPCWRRRSTGSPCRRSASTVPRRRRSRWCCALARIQPGSSPSGSSPTIAER